MYFSVRPAVYAEMHCMNVGCSESQLLSGMLLLGASVLLSGAAVADGSLSNASAAEDNVKVDSCFV